MDSKGQEFKWIEQVQAGDKEAFAPLVRLHHPKVIGLCYSLLGNLTQAEDAAQEVFIKAYTKIVSFKKESKFSTWLYRIATHHCMDLLRSRTRQKTDSWEELVEKKGDRLESLFLTPSNPGLSYEDKELVHQVLATLKPEYRNVLILRESQGFSYEEIAETMKWSLDSVKARLKRARQDLQGKLRHFYDKKSVLRSEVPNAT